ncbi:MAG: glycogen debranching N-terminal domain-containing protein, partial [bacterium]
MREIIQIDDNFYIRATSSLIDTRTQILMAGDTFAIFDRHGDIQPLRQAQGLYHEGTRFVSLFAITIGGEQPLLLNSSMRRDNRHLSVDLTNPDLRLGGENQLVRHELVHLYRDKFVWEGGYCERIRISNYASESLILPLEVQFGADFADIFEVRGTPRGRRGTVLPTKLEASQAIIDYQGTHGKIRRARFSFDPRPDEIREHRAVWRFRLSPRETRSLHIRVYCTYNGGVDPIGVGDCQNAFKTLLSADKEFRAGGAEIWTDNERFNQWIERSWADLQMLIALT